MKRTLTTISILISLSAVATAQFSDPNIVVPKSSISRLEDAGKRARTNYLIYKGIPYRHDPVYLCGPLQGAPVQGYRPQDIRAAYNVPASGGSEAIAIVDAFHLPTALADFNTFSRTFGLPVETSTNPTASTNKVFQVVYSTGTPPATDASWAGEIALDIEWAHAMAPNAKIILVEAPSNDLVGLYPAVELASHIPGVRQVSMSFGAAEKDVEVTLDHFFTTTPGVTFFASSGDIGGAQQYPAESPYVVAVGGTSLQMSSTTVLSETGWSGSGGGPSRFEPRPSFQDFLATAAGPFRSSPDLCAVADPATGAAVYSSYAFGGWAVIGGTSLACPVIAGITNTRGNFAADGTAELLRIYKGYGTSAYRDIVSGSAGPYRCGPGYDWITGIGAPVGPPAVAPPPRRYFPTAMAAMEGSVTSGTATALNNLDNVTVNLNSLYEARLGQVGSLDVSFTLDRAPEKFDSMAVLIGVSTPAEATVMSFFYNWKTSTWDFYKSYPGSSNLRVTMDVSHTYASYVRSTDKKVRMLFRTLRPLRYGSNSYVPRFDRLNLYGQPVH